VKILLVASRVPFPLHNGEDLRIFHFAKYLAKNHELTLLCYGRPPVPEDVAPLFRQVHFVAENEAGPTTFTGFQRVMKSLSPDEMYAFDKKFSSTLGKLVSDQHFDVIWAPAWQLVPYLRGLDDTPTAIDVMDDGVLELLREVKHSQTIAEAVIKLKRLFVTYRFERKFFSQALFCSAVTDDDANMLARLIGRARVRVIPNGVDTDYFQPLGLQDEFPSVVFEGNLSFAPSVDAIQYFHESIFPTILEQYPKTKLYLVGKDPLPAIKALAGPQVVVTGFVDDVRPYLDRATVFVCPMRKGAGIKNKMLQAWAMGKAVVATRVATAGLAAMENKNVLIANTAVKFAESVIRLFDTADLRMELGRHARQLVVERYSWASQARLFETELEAR